MARSPAEQLRVLRQYRNSRGKDTTIGADVERLRKDVTKRHSALGGLDSALEQHAPAGLAGRVRVQRVTPGGVATLEASDAAVAYEVDVWLRSGGLDLLRGACRVTLRRVRVVQDPGG